MSDDPRTPLDSAGSSRIPGRATPDDDPRKLAAALQSSEVGIRMAVTAAQLGSWRYEPPTGRITFDERCRTLYGLPQDATVDFDLILGQCHPDDRESVKRAIAAAIDSGGNGEIDHEHRTFGPDGYMRWVAARGQAIFDDNRCVELIGVVRDITREKLAEEEMRRVNRALRDSVDQRTRERDRIWLLSKDLLAIATSAGVLKEVNPAWTEVLGREPRSLIGTPLTDLVHPEDRVFAESMRHSLSDGTSQRFECRVQRLDGSYRVISWTAVPESGSIYAIGRDVTEERIASEEIESANRALRDEIAERERVEETLRQMQRLEAVGQLTSGVAHDFNNLLTVILGNIAFVEKAVAAADGDAKTLTRLSHMRIAAQRGAKLTTQLLAFSRRQRLEPKPTDLSEVVSGLRELLQSTMGGAIRLETSIATDLWPALVDPTQIELIILNLAINARDAMEVGGSLAVTAENVVLTEPPERPEAPGPGEYVKLSVADTGTGMTEDVLAHAVEPFFTTKEIGKGSGLGLAQVYGFAKQSGGGIRIDTRLGEGTTVSVFLPRAQRAAEEPVVESAGPPMPAQGKQKILLVDDDSAVREVAAATLQEMGYTVIEAGSGGSALEALDSDPAIDLLLVDFAMPGMNGGELARAARSKRPSLSILFITGYADLDALKDVGEDRIVPKPFRDGELALKVRQAIGRPWAKLDDGAIAKASTPGAVAAQD